MQHLSYIGLAFLMGATMSVYLPMNSSISRYVGSSITTNVVFFSVALLTSIVIFIVSGQFDTVSRLKNVPFYLYSSGLISAFIILGMTFLIPQIGARKLFVLLISSQVVMTILISHFGVLESPKDPVNIQKLIGATLVIIGAAVSVH